MSGGGRGRFFRVLGGLSASLSLIVPGVVVARDTYLEYETWKDQRWGLLDVWYNMDQDDMPRVPAWKCRSAALEPVLPGTLGVQLLWIGTPGESALTEFAWDVELAERLPFSFQVEPFRSVANETAARAYALAHPGTIVLALSPTYYRGAELNEPMEGFACGNLAVVTQGIGCIGRIAAHETGHVLGLHHSASGLMRARSIGCSDRLTATQDDWIRDRYGLADIEAGLPTGAESESQVVAEN